MSITNLVRTVSGRISTADDRSSRTEQQGRSPGPRSSLRRIRKDRIQKPTEPKQKKKIKNCANFWRGTWRYFDISSFRCVVDLDFLRTKKSCRFELSRRPSHTKPLPERKCAFFFMKIIFRSQRYLPIPQTRNCLFFLIMSVAINQEEGAEQQGPFLFSTRATKMYFFW